MSYGESGFCVCCEPERIGGRIFAREEGNRTLGSVAIRNVSSQVFSCTCSDFYLSVGCE